MLKILRQFPFFLLVVIAFAIAMLFPAFLAWQGEFHSMKQAFLRTSIITLLLSFSIGYLTVDRKLRGDYRDHLASLVLTYLILPFILALPIIQSIPSFGFTHAVYEMLSSLTTTGATLIPDTQGVNLPLLAYSCLVAWMGSFLIILLAFAVLEPANIGGFELISDMTNSGSVRSIGGGFGHSDRFIHYFKLLAPPYLLLTALLASLLAFSGEGAVYSIMHAWSVMSTSGFDPRTGINTGANHAIGEIVIFCFLLLGCSRLFLIRAGRNKTFKGMHNDPEIRVVLFVMTSCVLLFFSIMISESFSHRQFPKALELIENLWGSVFSTLSFLTSHGVQSKYWQYGTDIEATALPALILMGLTILGGGVATSAGGLKLLRVYALTRLGHREIARLIDPHSIAASGKVGRKLRRRGGVNAFVFLMLFLAGICCAALAFSFTGVEFEKSLVAAIASAANCGPLMSVLPTHEIKLEEMKNSFFIISGVMMIFGRVEVIVLAALINPAFWLEDRK